MLALYETKRLCLLITARQAVVSWWILVNDAARASEEAAMADEGSHSAERSQSRQVDMWSRTGPVRPRGGVAHGHAAIVAGRAPLRLVQKSELWLRWVPRAGSECHLAPPTPPLIV